MAIGKSAHMNSGVLSVYAQVNGLKKIQMFLSPSLVPLKPLTLFYALGWVSRRWAPHRHWPIVSGLRSQVTSLPGDSVDLTKVNSVYHLLLLFFKTPFH